MSYVNTRLPVPLILLCRHGLKTCGVETALIGRVKSGMGGTIPGALHIADEGTEHRDRGRDDGDRPFCAAPYGDGHSLGCSKLEMSHRRENRRLLGSPVSLGSITILTNDAAPALG